MGQCIDGHCTIMHCTALACTIMHFPDHLPTPQEGGKLKRALIKILKILQIFLCNKNTKYSVLGTIIALVTQNTK